MSENREKTIVSEKSLKPASCNGSCIIIWYPKENSSSKNALGYVQTILKINYNIKSLYKTIFLKKNEPMFVHCKQFLDFIRLDLLLNRCLICHYVSFHLKEHMDAQAS